MSEMGHVSLVSLMWCCLQTGLILGSSIRVLHLHNIYQEFVCSVVDGRFIWAASVLDQACVSLGCASVWWFEWSRCDSAGTCNLIKKLNMCIVQYTKKLCKPATFQYQIHFWYQEPKTMRNTSLALPNTVHGSVLFFILHSMDNFDKCGLHMIGIF